MFIMDGYRELEEESGVITKSLRQIGLLMFEFIGEPQLLEVHVYSTEEFAGTIVESEGVLCLIESWLLTFCSLHLTDVPIITFAA